MESEWNWMYLEKNDVWKSRNEGVLINFWGKMIFLLPKNFGFGTNFHLVSGKK